MLTVSQILKWSYAVSTDLYEIQIEAEWQIQFQSKAMEFEVIQNNGKIWVSQMRVEKPASEFQTWPNEGENAKVVWPVSWPLLIDSCNMSSEKRISPPVPSHRASREEKRLVTAIV